MNMQDVTLAFMTDFTRKEEGNLAKPSDTVRNMTQGNRVKVDVKMFDYLRDFQLKVYHGQPIPKVFDTTLIEVEGLKDGSVRRLYVTFPEDKPRWVYIDLFINWAHVAKLIYYNVQLPESNRDEKTGRYLQFTHTIMERNLNIPANLLQVLVSEARDIFTYTYLYVWANKENQEVFCEEDIPEIDTKGGKKSKKRHKKPSTVAKTRDTVHVPSRRRRIYTVKEVEAPKQHQVVEPTYHLEQWTVKGHTRRIVGKDGLVKFIPVKPHSRKRHKPITAPIQKDPGKDYILHERPLANPSET